MKKIILLLAIIAFQGSPALAGGKGTSYGGLQYPIVTYDEEGFDEAEPTALVGKFGQFMTENIALEGRIGFGLQDDEVDVGSFDIDVEVDSLLGIYGVFHSSSESESSFYGVIGYTRGELEGSAFGITISEDESG